jgi:hypothetical protein
MRRTDHSSRETLPTVVHRVCDLENLVNEEAIARVGLQRQIKKGERECKVKGILGMLLKCNVKYFLFHGCYGRYEGVSC